MTIDTWIGQAMAQSASDILLRTGAPPMMRVDGDLHTLTRQSLAHEDLLAWLQALPPTCRPPTLQAPLDFDAALVLPSLGRFRCNQFWHDQGTGVVLRPIPTEVPTLAGLQCPTALAHWASQSHGLVLVTGPTGSGKSSTLAAMVLKSSRSFPSRCNSARNVIASQVALTTRDISSSSIKSG